MDVKLFESLLYEDESETLDFKRDQYRFSQANDEQKAELLKDIAGFANAWRRADAHLLIGVEHVRGGRSTVVGVSEHLPDHSLQQFVVSALDRPMQFAYEAFAYEGKNVGVIRIARQPRPFQLTRSFGKLQKGSVYVRRGSSPTRRSPPRSMRSPR
jgi:predicted HTH transcriptional regulator